MTDTLMDILNEVSYDCWPYISRETYHNARNDLIHCWRNIYDQKENQTVLDNWRENCWKTFANYQQNERRLN